LFVIDFNLTPPQPIRARVGLEEGQVIDMAWSLDSSKLISITDKVRFGFEDLKVFQ